MGKPLIHRSPMPGLGLSMGITLTMLSIIVLLPIGALLAAGAAAFMSGESLRIVFAAIAFLVARSRVNRDRADAHAAIVDGAFA
mgnify:CR=1 FL=1